MNADLDRVEELAAVVREAFHAIVLELAPHYRGVSLDWVDGPAEGLGWTAIWEALAHIGDRFDTERGWDHLGLTLEQIEAVEAAASVEVEG